MKRHHLTTLLGLAALSLTLPFAAPAAAGSPGKGKPAKTKSAKVCQAGGKGYEVQGVLLEGSSLGQISGAATKRRSDDRWSGTLIVDVQAGNKRGRADRGVRTYEVVAVRLRGAAVDTPPTPTPGARVSLSGKQLAAKCTAPSRVKVEKVVVTSASDDDDEGNDDELEPEWDDDAEGEASGEDFFAGRHPRR